MIDQFKLRNGVRVLCERMESIRSVSVGVWIGAGSRYESEEHFGVSHFIEHMLFKGTRRRTTRQIAEEIDFVGGQMNAFTAKDCTCFYTKTLDSHLELAVDILSDILRNSKLLTRDVNLERNVILEEINMYEDSPDELAHDILMETAWRGCSLGNPILGRPETLKRTDRAAMRGFMASRYVPGNMVISVAGCFDAPALRALLEKYFGVFKGTEARDGFFEASDNAQYTADTHIKQKDTEQINLCVGFEGVELGNDDIYALHLANSIFGGGMSSALFQKIREELGLAYSIYSYVSAFRRAGMFTIYAGMQPENAERVFNIVLDEIKAFKESGMTADLLKKSKEQFKGSFYMGLENPTARMTAMGKSALLLGYINTPDEVVAKIEKVTLDDTYNVINRIFDMDKLAVSAVGRIDGGLEATLARQARHDIA